MKPKIRCGLTSEGHIEAATYLPSVVRLIVDRRTGDVIASDVAEGTDMFRWLVRAAREHVSK